jgi:type IV pilus assembly protein PilW
MTPGHALRNARRAQRGVSLVEIMVGVVIGLLAILVIYQVFSTSEQFKRNTTAAGDAQQNGLMSSFLLAVELASAGNAMMTAGSDLAQCPDTTTMSAPTPSLRPIPVLITDGGADDKPDSMIVNYSTTQRVIAPVLFTKVALAGDTSVTVQSPTGFAAGDQVVSINPGAFPPGGSCELSTVTAVGPVAAGTGEVVLSLNAGVANTYGGSALLFNLGPANVVKRSQYDVSGGVLRSTDLLTAGAAPNPLASNIVNLKMQYGIDDKGDGQLHTWVSGSGNWAPTNVLQAPLTPGVGATVALSRIKAVRIGIIVKSEQFDKSLGDYNWTLFDGTVKGTIAATVAPAGNWRFRIYETIIPLRNELWN